MHVRRVSTDPQRDLVLTNQHESDHPQVEEDPQEYEDRHDRNAEVPRVTKERIINHRELRREDEGAHREGEGKECRKPTHPGRFNPRTPADSQNPWALEDKVEAIPEGEEGHGSEIGVEAKDERFQEVKVHPANLARINVATQEPHRRRSGEVLSGSQDQVPYFSIKDIPEEASSPGTSSISKWVTA